MFQAFHKNKAPNRNSKKPEVTIVLSQRILEINLFRFKGPPSQTHYQETSSSKSAVNDNMKKLARYFHDKSFHRDEKRMETGPDKHQAYIMK